MKFMQTGHFIIASHGQPEYLGLWEPRGPTLTRGLIIDPLKKLVRFYQTMNEIEIKQMQEKINAGILLPESV